MSSHTKTKILSILLIAGLLLALFVPVALNMPAEVQTTGLHITSTSQEAGPTIIAERGWLKDECAPECAPSSPRPGGG